MSSTAAGRWQERVPDEPQEQESSSTAGARERVAHYDELIRFESRILRQMEELAATLSEEARKEVETSNIGPLKDLIDELRRRRDSWLERRDAAGY
jgi:hypothetical protein